MLRRHLLGSGLAITLSACGGLADGIGAKSTVAMNTDAIQTQTSALTTNTFAVHLSGQIVEVPAGDPQIVAGVNVADGNWCRTSIYPDGVSAGDGVEPIGVYYFTPLDIYNIWELPGGTISANLYALHVAMPNYKGKAPGSTAGPAMIGNVQLPITDATGAYAAYVGGKDTMRAKTVFNGPGMCDMIEDCTCRFTR